MSSELDLHTTEHLYINTGTFTFFGYIFLKIRRKTNKKRQMKQIRHYLFLS